MPASPSRSVIDLTVHRRDGASRPGVRDDGANLGLVIEGGGMRGVVAGGMVTALDALGLLAVFDGVYGASAGACAGAYFVAGQAALGTRIYYEDINNASFIALRRFASGRPVMNLDFLIDDVMTVRKRLDWDAMRNAGVPLRIVATDAERSTAVTIADFASRDELMEALRASARLPLLAGPPVNLRARRLVDGGVIQPVPLDAALDAGCSHLLALRTRPPGRLAGQPGFRDRRPIAPLIAKRFGPALARAYLDRPATYARIDDRLKILAADTAKGPRACEIRLPAGTKRVGRLETDRSVLYGAAIAGARAVFEAFAKSGLEIDPAVEAEALERLDPR